ncbi:hypothetical protein BCR44DRAFT_1042411 [Catenaria anguillulae PL171]|uniref:Uncharacterized protein n=1 Tax=Catenaria anguillulae PL171 TaxID=765915 RepID=A0A1Y2HRN7_9FUNG|nr:hypothetical protein BCR44DRAFT_1042411 [Catenaria anguillulae PL171]
MARNRKQRRAAERKAGAGAGTKTNGNAAAATTPSSELSVTGPAPATAASSSAPRMTNGGDLSRSSSTGSMGQAAVGMDAATPPTLRRAASSSSTTKAGRAKAKDLLPPSPFSPESPVSPTTGSSQGAAAPGLRSAAETSIDTLDDYIPALLATARKGSPAPAATSRSSATESPPPPASYPDPYEHPVAKSPVSPASNVTQSDQAGDASSILRTSILDPPTVTTLFATRTQIASPPIQLTADGKLASRTSLPQALAQARTALVASTYTSSLSSSLPPPHTQTKALGTRPPAGFTWHMRADPSCPAWASVGP